MLCDHFPDPFPYQFWHNFDPPRPSWGDERVRLDESQPVTASVSSSFPPDWSKRRSRMAKRRLHNFLWTPFHRRPFLAVVLAWIFKYMLSCWFHFGFPFGTFFDHFGITFASIDSASICHRFGHGFESHVWCLLDIFSVRIRNLQ